MPTSVFEASITPLGLGAALLGGAPPVRGIVDFAIQHQQQTQWCWAAVTASVAAYYDNVGWSQCQVVNGVLGQSGCCESGDAAECNQPWYLDRALGHVGNLGDYVSSALSESEIQTEIDAVRPIGVRIGWAGGGGHFVTLSGYSDQEVVDVQDPWTGNSSVDYSAFVSRYQGRGRWTHSYRTQTRGDSNAPPAPESAFWYI